MHGRATWRLVVSAVTAKPIFVRPEHVRRASEEKFAHRAWAADLSLSEIPTAPTPLYTLTDGAPAGGISPPWVWEYKGRYVNDMESSWLREREARHSFTALQRAYSTQCGSGTTTPITDFDPRQGVIQTGTGSENTTAGAARAPPRKQDKYVRSSWASTTGCRTSREGFTSFARRFHGEPGISTVIRMS